MSFNASQSSPFDETSAPSGLAEGKRTYSFKILKPDEKNRFTDFQNSLESKKKPGRKQDNTKPISKRIQQNRIAQRAFRERRENYIKNLETKVKELEEAQLKTQLENQKLMDYFKTVDGNSKSFVSNALNSINVPTTTSSSANSFENTINTSLVSNYTETPNNYNHPNNIFSSTSAGLSSGDSVMNQSRDKPLFSDYSPFTPYSGVTASDSTSQNTQAYTGQSPGTNLINDYMFPDVGAISSNYQYPSSMPANVYPDDSKAPMVPSYPSHNNTDFTAYSAQDYYPTSIAAIPQSTTSTLPALTPSKSGNSENESSSSPLLDLDPYEIMNPNRLPPTPQEVYKLVLHHKLMTETMCNAPYSIDELCDAMRKKATCATVHNYLSSYLGQDPLTLV